MSDSGYESYIAVQNALLKGDAEAKRLIFDPPSDSPGHKSAFFRLVSYFFSKRLERRDVIRGLLEQVVQRFPEEAYTTEHTFSNGDQFDALSVAAGYAYDPDPEGTTDPYQISPPDYYDFANIFVRHGVGHTAELFFRLTSQHKFLARCIAHLRTDVDHILDSAIISRVNCIIRTFAHFRQRGDFSLNQLRGGTIPSVSSNPEYAPVVKEMTHFHRLLHSFGMRHDLFPYDFVPQKQQRRCMRGILKALIPKAENLQLFNPNIYIKVRDTTNKSTTHTFISFAASVWVPTCVMGVLLQKIRPASPRNPFFARRDDESLDDVVESQFSNTTVVCQEVVDTHYNTPEARATLREELLKDTVDRDDLADAMNFFITSFEATVLAFERSVFMTVDISNTCRAFRETLKEAVLQFQHVEVLKLLAVQGTYPHFFAKSFLLLALLADYRQLQEKLDERSR